MIITAPMARAKCPHTFASNTRKKKRFLTVKKVTPLFHLHHYFIGRVKFNFSTWHLALGTTCYEVNHRWLYVIQMMHQNLFDPLSLNLDVFQYSFHNYILLKVHYDMLIHTLDNI